MATFQEQMMQTILPRFIEGMNQFNTRLKELEEQAKAEQPQSSDKDTTILVSKHDLALATIKDVLKNQLERIAVLDDIKVQLDNAIDRINDLEARMAEAKPVRRKRKAPAEEPAVE